MVRPRTERIPRQALVANGSKLAGWKRPTGGVKKTFRRLVGKEIYSAADAVLPRTAKPRQWTDDWPRVCSAQLKTDGTEAERQTGRDNWKKIVRSTISGAAAGPRRRRR